MVELGAINCQFVSQLRSFTVETITIALSGSDGQELPKLIEKAQKNRIKVTEVIGDMAYVSDDNLEV